MDNNEMDNNETESAILAAWQQEIGAQIHAATHPPLGGPTSGRERIDRILADWASLYQLSRELHIPLPTDR